MASLAVLAPSPLFRAGLAALLSAMGFERIEEAVDLSELERREIGLWRPDIVLLRLPRTMEGLGASIQEIRTWAPQVRVVVLAPTLDRPAMRACFAQGAAGYLLENISRDGLLHSLRLVDAGENVFPSQLADALSAASSMLNADELRNLEAADQAIDILRGVASGETNGSIAKKLGISGGDVSARLKHIERILGVSNRTQAALWGVAKGLATPFTDTTQHARQAGGEKTRARRKKGETQQD